MSPGTSRSAREANLGALLQGARPHHARKELYDAAAGLLVSRLLHGATPGPSASRPSTRPAEAVDLLGHHPWIAVWCAHNDPEQIGAGPGAAGVGNEGGRSTARFVVRQELPSWNRTILDRSVKRALDKADGSRPVIAHSGVLPHPPMLDGTDKPSRLRLVPRRRPRARRVRPGDAPDGALRHRDGGPLGARGRRVMGSDAWPDLDWGHLEAAHGFEHDFDDRVPRSTTPRSRRGGRPRRPTRRRSFGDRSKPCGASSTDRPAGSPSACSPTRSPPSAGPYSTTNGCRRRRGPPSSRPADP